MDMTQYEKFHKKVFLQIEKKEKVFINISNNGRLVSLKKIWLIDEIMK